MRVRALVAVGVLAVALISCSSGGTDRSPSLDAGLPPHPLEFEFEGLALGTTKEAVVEAWGPPSFEGSKTLEYANRGAFANIQLLFKSVPVSANIQPEASRASGDNRPYEFLTAIVLTPAEPQDKIKLKPELISLYGEPIADAPFLEAVSCRPPRCEIFRAAECALLQVHWEAASPGGGGGEIAATLSYFLAPDALISQVPRSLWRKLRGAVQPIPSSEFVTRLAGLKTGDNGDHLEDVVAAIGPPNLVLKNGGGFNSLYYFWLNNAGVKLSLAENTLRSISKF